MPAEIVRALKGRPAAGDWDPIFPLLTVDDAGFPHVCLLGRAELEADADRIYAVVSSTTTSANLLRSRRATLMMIGDLEAIYCKVEVDGEPTIAGRLLGVSLTVTSVKVDGIQIAMRPAQFQVTEFLAQHESWKESAALLARLRSKGS